MALGYIWSLSLLYGSISGRIRPFKSQPHVQVDVWRCVSVAFGHLCNRGSCRQGSGDQGGFGGCSGTEAYRVTGGGGNLQLATGDYQLPTADRRRRPAAPSPSPAPALYNELLALLAILLPRRSHKIW